jgi:dTDP-glucose pyrophosphorylase
MAILKSVVCQEMVPLAEGIRRLDQGGHGVLFIIDGKMKLLGLITDGDIRRAILKGVQLNDSVEQVMNRNFFSVQSPIKKSECAKILRERSRRHLPILDADGNLVDVYILDDSQAETDNTPIVLMVGGQGSRMGELTKHTPKPMLPLGGRPILEHIVRRCRDQGFHSFYLCTNHQSEIIQNHFQDGSSLGVQIQYTLETKVLGTGGALSLLKNKIDQPFIVMNGDVLTNVNLRRLLDFHSQFEGSLTLAAKDYSVEVPYGVIEVDGDEVKSLAEKPRYRYFTNAGIYVLDASTLQHIPDSTFFNMTDLVDKFIAEKKRVGVFPLHEGWIDIGRPEDYFNTEKTFKAER